MKYQPRTFVSGSVLFLAIALALPPAVGAFMEDQANGNAYYEQARQLQSEGRMAEAEQAFLRAIQEEPGNADYHFELSNLYAAIYDRWQGASSSPHAQALLKRSEQELGQVLTFRPDHLPARFNLAVVYKRERQFEKAREELRRVLQLSPQQAAAWYQIGSTYHEQGFWEEAQDAYLKAREMGYDPREIDEAFAVMQQDRVNRQQRSAPMGAFGSMNRNAFMNDPFAASAQNTDLFGRPSAYGDPANGYGQSDPSGSSMQSALPSLAAVMIQQMLARRSQNSQQNSQ